MKNYFFRYILLIVCIIHTQIIVPINFNSIWPTVFFKSKLNKTLKEALEKNNLIEAIAAIEKGADINLTTSEGVTPLLFAIKHNQSDFASTLIEKGATVNQYNLQTGDSPLFLAIKNKNSQLALRLIEHGADVYYTPKNQTFLELAIEQELLEVASKLIEQKAHIDYSSVYERTTPLMVAIEKNYSAIALELIKSGANLNTVDRDGQTPLIIATIKNNLPIMLSLIESGAQVNSLTDENITPIAVALKQNNAESAQLLIMHGAQIPTLNNVSPEENTHITNCLENPLVQFAIKYQTIINELKTNLQAISNFVNQ